MQNSFDIVRMQAPYLIHHAVYDEIAALSGCLFLENIDKHDVDHCLYKDVCSIRTYIIDTLYPVGIIVVLFHTEL